jgi:ribosome modulation factor
MEDMALKLATEPKVNNRPKMSKPLPAVPPGAAPVWAEGYTARLAGEDRQANPYLDTVDAQEDQWDDGWLYADGAIARVRALSSPEEER